MKVIEEGLEKLKKEQKKVEEDIARINETRQKTQQSLGKAASRRQELTTRVAPLQRLLDELTAAQAAIETQGQAAEREIKNGTKYHAELLTQIGKELPAARRKDIEAAIEAIGALKRKIAEAQGAMLAEQEHAATFEGNLRAKSLQLGKLPGEIQTARGQVTKLSAAARAAAAGGKTGEAFYLAHQLKQGLDLLSKLVATEPELVKQVGQEWKESQEAKARLVEKAAGLEQLKRNLTSAERDLQRATQRPEADTKVAPGSTHSTAVGPQPKSEPRP